MIQLGVAFFYMCLVQFPPKVLDHNFYCTHKVVFPSKVFTYLRSAYIKALFEGPPVYSPVSPPPFPPCKIIPDRPERQRQTHQSADAINLLAIASMSLQSRRHDETDDIEMAPLKEVAKQELPPPQSPLRKSSLSNRAGTSSVIAACFMYCFCSVSMVLTNKSLASG